MRWTLLLLLLVAGCQQQGRETSYVEGIVTVNGTPLSNGTVTFLPESGRSATGYIQENGRYVLGTYDEDDGAVIGMHKVAITASLSTTKQRPNFDVDRPQDSAKQSLIPLRYADPDSSGLTFPVEAGANNQANFDLQK